MLERLSRHTVDYKHQIELDVIAYYAKVLICCWHFADENGQKQTPTAAIYTSCCVCGVCPGMEFPSDEIPLRLRWPNKSKRSDNDLRQRQPNLHAIFIDHRHNESILRQRENQ